MLAVRRLTVTPDIGGAVQVASIKTRVERASAFSARNYP